MIKPKNLTYDAQFFLDKEKGKPTSRIRFRVKWDKNTLSFNLGYRVDISKWSVETQRCVLNTTHGEKKISAKIINKRIDLYRSAIEDIFNGFIIKNILPTENQVRDSFNRNIGRRKTTKKEKDDKTTNLVQEVFDSFITSETIVNQWTLGTIKKMKSVKKKLYEFKPQLLVEKIDESHLLGYQLYLQNKGYQNSTVLKNIVYLKWFLRWVEKRGYVVPHDYKFFKPKLKTTSGKIIFLTRDELKKLASFKIPDSKKHLEKIRDVFLFLCFTGLRYSDVQNLKKSDVNDDYIEVTTVKTSDNLIIELNDHSKLILNKYKNCESTFEKALPVISNQKMNDQLKELTEMVGFEELIRRTYFKGNKRIDIVKPKWSMITTHVGRRTFICNALSLGIPVHVVMKWTGHSNYESMKPYIDVADKLKSISMEKFNVFSL